MCLSVFGSIRGPLLLCYFSPHPSFIASQIPMELQQKLLIERASLHHSRNIWEWRNDEVTRSVSRNSEVVTWDEHDALFRRSIVNPDRFFYVGIPIRDPQQSPIGVVRFYLLDSKKGYWEISINMSPGVRGKGFGRLLLECGTRAFVADTCDTCQCRRIYAEVKIGNIASSRLFASAGFSLCDSSHEGFLLYSFDL